MKKISLYIIVISLMWSFSACASKEINVKDDAITEKQNTVVRYNVFEMGGTLNQSQANHSVEFVGGKKIKSEKEIENEYKYIVDGQEYSLTYDHTEEWYWFGSETVYYSIEQDGKQIEIGINKETGRVDSYWFAEKYYSDENTTTLKNDKECLEIAKQYLANYVEEANAYELIDINYSDGWQGRGLYTYEFRRIVAGVQTMDAAYIGVMGDGTIKTHTFQCLGQMKDIELPNENLMGLIEKDIDKKLIAIYGPLKGDYSVTYEMSDMVYLRLLDGRYAIEYSYEVSMSSLKEDAVPFTELTKLIVVLEDVEN